VAKDIEDVKSVEVTLDLNNISEWELEHMTVADGFEATYDLLHDENIADISITRKTDNKQVGKQILVSIPTRTWQLAPTVAIYGHAGKVWMYPDYKKGNEILPMDLSVEVDAGLVTYVNGTFDSFASPRIQVDTELSGNAATSSGSAGKNYIRNEEWYAAWNGGHDHRVETAKYYVEGATNVSTPTLMEDKLATCTEPGYVGRTYCEVCDSIVDWGETVYSEGHTYEVIDANLVCDCGEVINTTGLIKINDITYYVIGGVLQKGWQYVDVDWYYFQESSYAGAEGALTVGGISYNFDNGLLTEGVWVSDSIGSRYYYGPNYYKASNAGFNEVKWQEIAGNTYGFDLDGYRYENICCILESNRGSNLYEFTNDGVLVGAYTTDQTGLIPCNKNRLCYVVEGIPTHAGLIRHDDDYYYIDSSCMAVIGEKNVTDYWSNGLLPAGIYNFGEDGKLIADTIKNGLVEENGSKYYYVDGIKTYAGLIEIDGDIYYINSSFKAVTGKYWVVKNNGLMESGFYNFDEDGKLIVDTVKNGLIEEDGVKYYYVDDVKTYAGLIEIDGDIYYINSSFKAVTGKYWVVKNNGLMESGFYNFDENGKMIK